MRFWPRYSYPTMHSTPSRLTEYFHRNKIFWLQLTGHPEAHSKERTTVILDALHWDAERGVYADWGLHTENVTLRRVPPHNRVERVVGDDPVDSFVPHFGYVSLFPLLLERLRTSANNDSKKIYCDY